MSAYNQYLNKVKNQEITSYQEAKKHLDDLVELGLIDNYDESKIKDLIKNALLIGTMALPFQKDLKAQELLNDYRPGVENVINVKKDIKNLEDEISSLERHSKEFQERSKHFNDEIEAIKKGVKYLKKGDLIDESRFSYYTNIINTLKKYIQDSTELDKNFNIELNIKKEK